MRSKASHQVQMAADDITAEIASISAMKHKLLEEDSDVTTPNKKPHMDTAAPSSEDHQQQQEHQPPIGEDSDTASTISASTSFASTTSSLSSGGTASAVSTRTFFDPTKDPVSSVFLGGAEYTRAADVQRASDAVMLCYDLDQEMATMGWIKSRATESREQDDLLILFQQVCKKPPTKYVSAGLYKNEDSHAHSASDALMTGVFPGNHRHFELHWANRKSKGSRGGDHLAKDD
ncbi:hypothetical protein BGZ58_010559 [Dissophora ornata]|nr:hypothetical protein BGZ58_010559 [Dissophora ornata]